VGAERFLGSQGGRDKKCEPTHYEDLGSSVVPEIQEETSDAVTITVKNTYAREL